MLFTSGIDLALLMGVVWVVGVGLAFTPLVLLAVLVNSSEYPCPMVDVQHPLKTYVPLGV